MRLFIVLCMSSLLMTGCSKDQSKEIEQLKQDLATAKAQAGPPPSSLDNFYPTKAQGPAYQMAMFGMSMPLTGSFNKLMEGDPVAAKAMFVKFKEQYINVSKMVPEWEHYFPMEPVTELESLLATPDMDKIMAAGEKVGKVCHTCHVDNMAKVQQKYHWPDFSILSITDPVSKQDVPYANFMLNIDMSFTGIGLEMEQGQVEKARRHFDAFNARFHELKNVCIACHQTERKYYVDDEIQRMINKLGDALKKPAPDPKVIQDMSMQIGMESCMKCHNVHVPATYAKYRWMGAEQQAQK